jgi:thymidylate synthase (FAD)
VSKLNVDPTFFRHKGITILTAPTVELVDSMGGDQSIIRAAQVSVVGHNNPEDFERDAGLIGYLMREHHGSPFEHNAMTFYVKAPIFVFREFQRHRVGFSYNERSGRYSEMLPEFFGFDEDRKIVPSENHKPSKPDFVKGTPEQIESVRGALEHAYQVAWDEYQDMLDDGIANEVARSVLPLALASEMYVTVNARSVMNFLSLRTLGHPKASFVSRPQREIADVADKIEDEFARLFPLTYEKFNQYGRVAP